MTQGRKDLFGGDNSDEVVKFPPLEKGGRGGVSLLRTFTPPTPPFSRGGKHEAARFWCYSVLNFWDYFPINQTYWLATHPPSADKTL